MRTVPLATNWNKNFLYFILFQETFLFIVLFCFKCSPDGFSFSFTFNINHNNPAMNLHKSI